MKKLLALALSLVLVISAMTLAVSAASDDFVMSPGQAGAPEVINDPKTDYTVGITAYKDRDSLSEEKKTEIEAAYNDLAGASDLSKIVEGVDLKEGVEDEIGVGEVFDASIISGTAEGAVSFKLRSASFADENFVALLHYVNGKFVVVDDVTVKGDVADISVDSLSPFAIIVNANYNEAPVTDDITMKIAIPGAVCFALIGAGLIALSKKKED